MAFVDEVVVHAQSGKGGDGAVRWLHTKGKARGGPSGGDGGRGGDVILRGVRDLSALSYYRYEKTFRAKDGESGEGTLKHGADGMSIFLDVPIGTVASVRSSGVEHEISHEGGEVVIFKGGAGGKGNARFKSSTNQNPFQRTLGKDGDGGDVKLTLKIIADAGLIGLPNAGKSSLLNALTHSHSKVGAYPFTTLEPHLGDFYGHIIADIPGLVEGASSGKGFGTKFLKHVERTGILIHLVATDHDDPLDAYKTVRQELASSGQGLLKKKELIVLTKTDLVLPQECEVKKQLLARETGRDVFSVSTEDPEALKSFSDALAKILQRGKL